MTAAELLAHELAAVALGDGERRYLTALAAGETPLSHVAERLLAEAAERIRGYPERLAECLAGADVPSVEADRGPEGALPVTDALIEDYLAGLDAEPELDELLFGPAFEAESTAKEQLADYHELRAPRAVEEAVTAAHLLGLPTEAIAAIRRDWGKPSLDRRDVLPLPPLRGVGALAAWHRALAAGRGGDPASPSTWVLDDLWRAACSEQSAWNAEALGMHESARRDMDKAAELLGVKPVAPTQSAPGRPSARRPALSGLDRIALARARTQRNP